VNIITIQIISFFILLVLGSLLHFTHAWFKKGILLHFFSALNESTWEHMKMLVAPTLIVTILQYFLLKDQYGNLNNSFFILLFIEILTIPALFETLKRIVKKVPFAITITIFVLAIIFGLIGQYFSLINNFMLFPENVALIIYVFIILCFAIFSYYPPKFFIFKDPITGKYGDVNEQESKRSK